MHDNSYRKAVVGSKVTLPVKFLNERTGELEVLTGRDVTIRIADANETLVITDAACDVSGTEATYEWDPAGPLTGKHLIQFTLDGDIVEPATPLTIYLVDVLGA